MTVRWAPATFSPAASDDRLDVGFIPLGGGGGATALHCYYYGPGAAAAFEVADVVNGEQLLVTLDLAASDPLVNGIPGSASGVSQMAVDEDGDGTYPCPSLLNPDADASGCATAYASSTVRRLSGRVTAGAFTTTLTLPAHLLSGTYALDFVGPGGTLSSSLTLIAPREGVLRDARLHVSRERAQALFTFAAQPSRALRARPRVVRSQRGRRLGVAKAQPGTRVHASLPSGTTLLGGPLVADLRAGSAPVGHAAAGVG